MVDHWTPNREVLGSIPTGDTSSRRTGLSSPISKFLNITILCALAVRFGVMPKT